MCVSFWLILSVTPPVLIGHMSYLFVCLVGFECLKYSCTKVFVRLVSKVISFEVNSWSESFF